MKKIILILLAIIFAARLVHAANPIKDATLTGTVSLKGYVVDSFAASLLDSTNSANMASKLSTFATTDTTQTITGDRTYSGLFNATGTVSIKGYVVDSFVASLLDSTNSANMASKLSTFATTDTAQTITGDRTYSGLFNATGTVSIKGYVVDSYAASLMTTTNASDVRSKIGAYGSGDNPTFLTVTATALIMPSNSGAIYFSANLSTTGSGTDTNPYGLSGRDPGAFINGLNLTNSSTLIFLPGTYTFSTPINITTKDKWTFDGVSANGTVFVPSATFSGSAIISTEIAFGVNLKGNHTIQNITFNGNNNDATLGAIFLYSYGYNTVKNCRFVNWPKYVYDAYAIIVFKIDDNASGYANKSNTVSFCTFSDFAANATTTYSGIGGCVGAYSGNVPDATTQYTEVNVTDCVANAGTGSTHAFWHSYGARGSVSNCYMENFPRAIWCDTYRLENFKLFGNKFIVTTTVSSANQVWISGTGAGSVTNLSICNNYFQDLYNATNSGVLSLSNATYPLISGNTVNHTQSNFSAFNLASNCTRSSLIGNVLKINEINMPAGTMIAGNVIDASSITMATASSTFIGNRTSLGALIAQLPDTLKPVSGTSTFSSGVVTSTVSGLRTGQKLSITQHADGTVANTGVGVSYTVGSGFATFTSSNALANNSFDWVVSVYP